MQRKSQRHPRSLARIGIVLAASIASAGLVACAPSPTDAPPTVDFGANGGTPVGMAPMPAMSGMPSPVMTMATIPSAPVAGTAVRIENFAFVPAAAGDGSFHSPGMDANGTYSFTFTTPGSFDYICSMHPFMHGTVVVQK